MAVFNGTSGKNTLNGTTDADTLIGGLGDDSYIVNNAGDVVAENAGEGTDRVLASVTYTLVNHVENLYLTGGNDISGIGNDADNVISGARGNNALFGGAGNDVLVDGSNLIYNNVALSDVGKFYLSSSTNALINNLGGDQNFGEAVLTRNDDESSNAIDITSVFGEAGINFFGTNYTSLFVNTNGNLTFESRLSTYTPSEIGKGYNSPIIAAFWADVDTRAGVTTPSLGGNSLGTNQIFYDLDAENGVFTATWDDVGYYAIKNSKVNSFQIQLIKRGTAGDFDILFRYETINWTTGDASSGRDGLGGEPARVGYTAGDGVATYELPISGDQNRILELDTTQGNTGRTGIYVYNVRNGAVFDPGGNDVLNGGTGVDTMAGGVGNDTYIRDNVGDLVLEAADEGIDSVQSSLTYVLPDHVENLTLTGIAHIDATGNVIGNVLVGNSANNVLDGGVGIDTMTGGQGNDTYIVDHSNDLIIERPDSGLIVTRANTTATGSQVLGGASTNAKFSADGTRILFESLATNLVGGDTNTSSDIFVKNINTGVVTRINTNSTGMQANGGNSSDAAFSADGVNVIFRSDATNLVDNDTNAKSDIFVKNLTTGAIARVNTDSLGAEANDETTSASLSADGTKVVFASSATNLVTGDINASSDIFLKDLKTGKVTRLSTDSVGTASNGNSFMPQFSSDGLNVVFISSASNLSVGDLNGMQDVFIKNLISQEVIRVNVTENGTEANNHSYDAVISADGTKVLFASDADNLVIDDKNGVRDLFVKDLTTGVVSRISTNDMGVEGNAASYNGQFSADGSKVVFVSSANNFVLGDNNGLRDVFVKDLVTGAISRVSTATEGTQGNGISGGNVAFSADGSRVAFDSAANNLVSGDVNGTTDIFIATLPYTNSGIDSVQSSASYSLSSNVEHLTLTGTASIDGAGNDLANQIMGNNGDNILTGGAGNDTLNGGFGRDIASYSSSWVNYDLVGDVNNATVTARAGGNEGIDTLISIESLKFSGTIVSLVDAINDAPIGVADTNTNDVVVEAGVGLVADASAKGNVLTNDTDIDFSFGLGETKTVSAINGQSADVGVAVLGTYGSVVINVDGSYTYTLDDIDTDTNALASGQLVTDTFNYTVVDAHGLTGTATLTIRISGSNDAPVGLATAVLVTGTENTQYVLNKSDLLQGFSDVDSNTTLSIANLTADQGQITDNQNGTYTLTPTTNYHGLVNLSYSVKDNHNASITASQSFTLFAAVNHAPTGTATAVLATATEDVAYVVSVSDLLQGFSDIDGNTLTINNLAASQGMLVNNNNGTYTLTPSTNFNGDVSLSYSVIDNNGGSLAATQHVNFASVNDLPTGTATAALTAATEDVKYVIAESELLQGFSDVDGTLHVGQLTATHATIANNQNGTYTITTAANYNGMVDLTYNVIDGNGGSLSATQQFNVLAVNDAPVGQATAILAAAVENKAYVIKSSDLLQGFSDAEENPLAVANVAVSQGTIASTANGTYTITPPSNYVGVITLTYNVVDGLGGSIAASQNVDVLSAASHTPIGVATAVLMAGTEDNAYIVSATDLLQGFSSVDGGVLSVGSLASAQGVVTNNQNGTYTITPIADYNGQVSLSYQVVNSTGGSLAATQSFILDAVNDAPTGVATAVLATGTEDTAYVVKASDLLQGLMDVDGDTLTLSHLAATHGSIINNQNGTYTITPTSHYNGVVDLSYDVVDGNGGSLSVSQHLTLNAVNDAPTGVATTLLAAGTEDTVYVVNASDLLQGFTDAEGDTLAISNLSSTRGIVVDNQNGTYSITPSVNFNGTLVLNYHVVDGKGGSIAATQSLQLAAVNDAPTGTPTGSLVAAIENREYVFSASQLLLGFSDADNEALTVNAVTSNLGTVKDNLDGTYTLTPPSNYNGMIQLNYNVTDGKGGNLAATQQFNVIVVTQMLVGTTGADTLQGGGGNDTYVVNNTGDVVTELNNASIDTVLSSVDYTLSANIEHLTLAGSANINGTGNNLNNNIKGNDGNNRLEGGDGNDTLWGGQGVDTLIGGQGSDTYYVDNINDVVSESAHIGYEFNTIYSSVDYTLSAHVERLILQGTDNLNGTGNDEHNTLEGNSANNSLVGGAGDDRLDGMMGIDTLKGGLGSDFYTVDNVADEVVELANEGVDVVSSSVDYSLSAHVERLFLTGTANLTGTGNDLHNTLYGNSGDNLLSGGIGNDTLNAQAGNDTLDGGLGNDYLKGGLGNDTYVFGLNAGRDTIDNSDAGNGNDKVLFGAGITTDQVWLRQVNSDLEVSIIGTTDRVLMTDWYSNTAKQVDSLVLSTGEVLLASEVQNLVTAMAAFTPPSLGQTSLNTAQHTALDSVIAVSW